MVDHLHPEFHAEVIKELYGELECYQLVTEQTRRLLQGYSRPSIWQRLASNFPSTCSAFARLAKQLD